MIDVVRKLICELQDLLIESDVNPWGVSTNISFRSAIKKAVFASTWCIYWQSWAVIDYNVINDVINNTIIINNLIIHTDK